MKSKRKFVRRGKIIYRVVEPDGGLEVLEEHKFHNAAKRASAKLQREHDGGLGRGVLSVQ